MASRQSTLGISKSRMPFRIKISPVEASYRSSHFTDVTAISASQLSCTKCNIVLKPRMVSDKNVHPILEVLLCRKCRYFYDQRQSQSQNYCIWCANDRSLFGCSVCSAKYCEDCINKNFHLARTVFQEIKERKWKCCICLPKPIFSQRAICAVAKNFADSSNSALKERIARCNAVKKSSSEQVSNQSTKSHSVTTQSHTVYSVSISIPICEGKSTLSISSAPFPQSEKKILQSTANKDTANGICDEEKSSKQSKTESSDCVICLLTPSIMVLYPCGHKCLCKQCSTILSLRERLCPLCRKEFKDVIRLYE